jgi:hypothetical protein
VPAAELPSEFAWAAPSSTISRALAGWAAVVERIGSEMLSPQVRALMMDFLQTWQGAPAPLSRVWVTQAVVGLPKAEQAAGTLALLAAVAPHQIDAEIIRAFRAQQETDEQLVGVVAWPSFAAACRIASWLQAPTPGQEGEPLQYARGQGDTKR